MLDKDFPLFRWDDFRKLRFRRQEGARRKLDLWFFIVRRWEIPSVFLIKPRLAYGSELLLAKKYAKIVYFSTLNNLDFIALRNISTLMNKHIKNYERET